MAYSNLGITEATPQDPAQTNIWAATVNTNMTLIDNAIAGVLPLSVAGSSNVVLTATAGTPNQYRNAVFNFSGTITSNIAVLWPAAVTIPFLAANQTSGAFALALGVNNGSGAVAGASVTVPQGALGSYYSDGTNIYAQGPAPPTRTTYTSGSAQTYTTKFGCTRLFIRMVAGGGGGGTGDGGSGGPSGTNASGSVGTDSIFNSVHATAGLGGIGNSVSGNAHGGGGGANGSGAASFRSAGGGGAGGQGVVSGANGNMGGAGGCSALGGGQLGGFDSASNSTVGYGGGGGGGETGNAWGSGSGAGGGAGEYVELNINSPGASYVYTVGSGGPGGVAPGNFTGGNGGNGVIIVDEYY